MNMNTRPTLKTTALQREAKLWQRMSSNLPSHIRARRLETRHPPGLSDVYWTFAPGHDPAETGGTTDKTIDKSGWIELKSNDTHIRKEQRLWLRDMRQCGINAWILAEYGSVICLVDPMTVGLDLKMNFLTAETAIRANASREEWNSLWDNITRGGK